MSRKRRDTIFCGYGCRLESGAKRAFADHAGRLAHEVQAHGRPAPSIIESAAYRCKAAGCRRYQDNDTYLCGPCRAARRKENVCGSLTTLA